MILTIGISASDLPRTAAIYNLQKLTPDKNNRGVLHIRQGQDRDPHLAMGKDRETHGQNRDLHLAMDKDRKTDRQNRDPYQAINKD